MKWRFETWNEPDLEMFNVLNFTFTGKLLAVSSNLNESELRANFDVCTFRTVCIICIYN